jgi:glycosyltransferase involved in cell wall biosynthesis
MADARLLEKHRLTPHWKVRHVNPVFRPIQPLPQEPSRALFEISRSTRAVLWVGRFDEQKDPMTFVEAMEQLRDADVIGLMVGDGPLMRSVSERVRKTRPNIVLTGWLQDPAAPLAAADIYVSTSRWEGLALSVLEAAAARLPLVLSDCPGNFDCKSLASDVSLFPTGDSQALAESILLSPLRATPNRGDGSTYPELGALVESHSAERLAETLIDIYARAGRA